MTDRRTPPYSIEAEQSLLGAILLRPSILGELVPVLDPTDFAKADHASVYSAAVFLHDHGQPIDTVTISDFLGDEFDRQLLVDVQNATPSTSAYRRYAEIVIDTSRRRRALAHFAECSERIYLDKDLDEILDYAASPDRLLLPRTVDISGLMTIGELMAKAETEDFSRPWLIPHIFKALWRIIVIAPEGIGKAVLMRFLALHAAAGRDPWQPSRFIEPVKCLYIDVENPTEAIAEQVRVANRTINLVEEAGDNMVIWHREGGMNLRDRRTQAEMEAVLQQVKPQLVFAGPLYKLFRRTNNEDLEAAALSFTEVMDGLRVRYGFGLMLEHHAPKGSSNSTRDMNPFGSSLFLRWPEIGLTMEPIGNPTHDDDQYVLELGRFRRDRVRNDWPLKIERGAPMSTTAWSPSWPRPRGAKLDLTWVDSEWHHVHERF